MTAPKNILTHTVDIAVDDGTTMGGYVARPAEPGPHPGVVVAMELFGLSAHVREVCERLATLGFVTVAPDLYHRTAPGVELAEDAAGRERGFELLHQQTREQVLRDIAAAIDRLHADGRTAVGMVGLSVGGHVAYLAANEFDLPAVAVVYGGWLPTTDIPLGRPEPTLARTPQITGRLLILVGEDDQVVPEEHRRRMLKYAFNLIDDGLVGQQLFAGEATRLAYGTEEAAEGRDAFLEKRPPDWSAYPHFY